MPKSQSEAARRAAIEELAALFSIRCATAKGLDAGYFIPDVEAWIDRHFPASKARAALADAIDPRKNFLLQKHVGEHDRYWANAADLIAASDALRTLPTAHPTGMEDSREAELDRIMALSDEEVTAETIAAGEDPDKIVEKHRQLLADVIVASRALDAAATEHARSQSNSEFQRTLMHDAFVAGAEYQRMVALQAKASRQSAPTPWPCDDHHRGFAARGMKHCSFCNKEL